MALIEIARRGLVDQLDQEHHLRVHQTDWEKRTPLHWAAASGHKAMMERLVDLGADLNSQDRWGFTPMHLSCVYGQVESVMCLLARGADVNIKDKWGATPLGVVCMAPSPEVDDDLKSLKRQSICAALLQHRKASHVNATTSSLSSTIETAAPPMPSLAKASSRPTGAIPHYQLPTISHPQRPPSSSTSSSGHHQPHGRSSIKTTPTSSPATRRAAGGRAGSGEGGRPSSGDNQRVGSRGSNSSGAPSRRSLDDESCPSPVVGRPTTAASLRPTTSPAAVTAPVASRTARGSTSR